MSDNTQLSTNVGSGDVIRNKDRTGVKTQIVALDLNPAGAETLMAGAMPVTGTFWQTTQPVSAASLPLPSGAATAANQATEITGLAAILSALGGTLVVSAASLPLPTGAATAAKQDTGNTSLASIDGKVTACNTGAIVFASAQPITVASLPLPAGAATSAKQDTGNTSVASIDTKTPSLGQALAAASVPVVLTAAQITTLTPPTTVAATQSGTWTVGVSAAQTIAVTNAGTFAVQVSSALPAGANVIGHVIVDSGTITTVSTVTNLAQMAGAAISMGTGVRGAGTQRVTICTDDVVPISIGTTGHGTASGAVRVELPTDGTGQVCISQTTPGTTNAVVPVPVGAGAMGVARVDNASGTSATLVKNTTGQLYGWYLYNNAASIRAIHLYNSSSTPTAGSGTPLFTVVLPANGGANVHWNMGIPFSVGIGYTITTGIPDADTGSCSAQDVEGVILYK